jgi:hypothetical protein
MFLCAIEERLDALDNLQPLDRKPDPQFVEELLAVFASALGLEAEENLDPDVPISGDPEDPK